MGATKARAAAGGTEDGTAGAVGTMADVAALREDVAAAVRLPQGLRAVQARRAEAVRARATRHSAAVVAAGGRAAVVAVTTAVAAGRVAAMAEVVVEDGLVVAADQAVGRVAAATAAGALVAVAAVAAATTALAARRDRRLPSMTPACSLAFEENAGALFRESTGLPLAHS